VDGVAGWWPAAAVSLPGAAPAALAAAGLPLLEPSTPGGTQVGSAGLEVDAAKIVWTPYNAEKDYEKYRN
jgi:hypothetical protein